MFSSMFSRKKKSAPKREGRKSSSGKVTLNSFGLPDTSTEQDNDEELEAELRAISGAPFTISSVEAVGEDGESDLEAELEQLMGHSKKKKGAQKKNIKRKESPPVHVDVEKIVNQVQGDSAQENVVDDDFGDEEIDENDPDLMNELLELTKSEDEDDEDNEESSETSEEQAEPTLLMVLQERLEMYKIAESKAKENKETSRVRRFTRGIKTLLELIKKAEHGEPVLPSEIPPLIALNLKPPSADPEPTSSNVLPTRVSNIPENPDAPEPNRGVTDIKTTEDSPVKLPLKDIKTEDQYINSKEPHKVAPAENVMKTKPPEPKVPSPPKELKASNKQELPNLIIKAAEERNNIASSTNILKVNTTLVAKLQSLREEYKINALKAKKEKQVEDAVGYFKNFKILDTLIAAAENGEEIDESIIPPYITKNETKNLKQAMKMPSTIIEALNQRLEIFSDLLGKAKQDGQTISAQKYAKIVKVYSDAIKLHNSGKKVPYEKLPTPPGCPPIPVSFQMP